MKKILIVFGTRPEAIKMAPLVQNFRKLDREFSLTVCVTGQHRKMLDQVLEIFKIKPDIDLNLMSKNQTVSDLTAKILVKIQRILLEINPDIVLVHGDTTTAFATAIASFNEKIPVGHVEAGLRTFDVNSPYPEELNRQIISKIALFHFAPTTLARRNLLSENIKKSKIYVTGNTIVDALNLALDTVSQDKNLENHIISELEKTLKFSWQSTPFILITAHRRENFGNGLVSICNAISKLSKKFPDIFFVYPVHKNPRVVGTVNERLGGLPNIRLIEPQDYIQFLYLQKYCMFMMTDSGGMQEEAPSLGKPVLLMRLNTERIEAINNGNAKLVGTNEKIIFAEASKLISNPKNYQKIRGLNNPFGEGKASEKIIDILKRKLN